MVPKKSKSKRKTIRQQYTSRKLYFQRKRKMAKEEKRAIRNGKVIQKQKDPGIPNSWPFKEELLQKAKEMKESEEREKEEARQRKRMEHAKAAARERGEAVSDEESEIPEEEQDPGVIPNGDLAKVLTHVVSNSDVILEIIDARDVINSRCFSVEKALTTEMKEKILILVITKIDLVPKEVLLQNVALIKEQIPVILWKSTLPQIILKKGMKPKTAHVLGIRKYEKDSSIDMYSFGYSYLLQLLQSIQQATQNLLSVCVIGYPKTGRHAFLTTFLNQSPVYLADNQSSSNHNELRRVEQNIYMFTRPGEVVLKERVTNSADYLYKCYPYGHEKIVYDELARDIISVSPKVSICYYYHYPMYENYEELMNLINEKVCKNSTDFIRVLLVENIVEDWNQNRLPHYAEPEACSLITIDNEDRLKWMSMMQYQSVAEAMLMDKDIDRFSGKTIPRTIVTKNIQPVEEELDYSCFLSKEEMSEEEVPELVEDDQMEEEDSANSEEEAIDDDDEQLLMSDD